MQSGGGSQQGGGHGRSTVASASASPSSSSSAVSTPQLVFDHQQHQQQQQQQQRQAFQQHFLRRPELNNDALLAYHAGNIHGPRVGPNFSTAPGSTHPRKFTDLSQHHGSPSTQEQAHNPSQTVEQQMSNNMQQAYFQAAFQAAAQQKSALGIQQSQHQIRPGSFGPQSQASSSKKAPDQGPTRGDKPADIRPNYPTFPASESIPGSQSQQNIMNMSNYPNAMSAQMQAMQALALERNIDLSHPANANVVAQLIPLLQQPRTVSQPKANESGGGASAVNPTSFAKQNVTSPRVASESFSVHGRDNQLPQRQPNLLVNGMPNMQSSSGNLNQGGDSLLTTKSSSLVPIRSPSQSNDEDMGHNKPSKAQAATLSLTQQPQIGFRKEQLHVLKAQILAFRRLKKDGNGNLPREVFQAIIPPPLDTQIRPMSPPAPVIVNKDRPARDNVDGNVGHYESIHKLPQVNKSEEKVVEDDRVSTHSTTAPAKESRFVVPPGKEEQQSTGFSGKSEQEAQTGIIQKTPIRTDVLDRGKAIVTQPSTSDTPQVKKPAPSSNTIQPKDNANSTRKYHGPLFDFPVFTRKHDALGSSAMMNSSNNNLTLAYEIKDLFAQEGGEICKRKRAEKIEKIDQILAVNLERKRIKPDLIIRLQIESKKLQLAEFQARLREEIEKQQLEILGMPDRPYRKFVRLCERQRQDLNRQSQAVQKGIREKQLKSIFQWRKKLLEAHWAIRDARIARNRGVHKYHERMLREFSKRKDDGRDKRMEALKNNDVERYREMLLEQQTNITGEAAERYAVLSSFLTQTEEYLHKLGGKITATKNQQEVQEAANAAAAAAHAQGLSEEEIRAASACAREEVMIRNRFSEMNAPKDSSSVNKYYNLAHAVNERVIRQPSMLRAGTLRDYQLVGLQWMLSLYNNKLNGILADEMGLGKTVQVMALIAYLMEFKGNYGPHLIIVPNAVLVNWKSELHSWLPTVSCIYYVGGKDQRSKLFSQEVLAMKFNVLVTTYEFIMYDRTKLSKVDWKYIIIDEAQRMKDRESVLARDLDRYRCQRRLLLTGTPLQNDLKELWSLLNLLLPEVFDNRKAFHDWFSQPFQKESSSHNAEDDWLETEKKVIVIHRLHQILEPFMLRRRVEDVEGSLPPKISIVLKCRMSAIQSAIYDWIKSTGTLRVDPEDEDRRVQKNPNYQPKIYKPLNNRCMELRKACNHPLLNYPYFSDISKDFLVRSCGKLWVMDRVLVKLHRTGHRVLLFSTMTKLLDIMEEYLNWRRLAFRRIDGTTSLEDRESAIVDFNSPDTNCFIFLLSIRAAGRGLNLQSADTVIIYDPDPNPKNEEQAVARAHRIGQKREVKVIYMEAVVDKISSAQKEDEFRTGGTVDSDDDFNSERYMGSIESLIRNNIQQYKIDMADEVINAGRFDQRTTHEERRLTLETMLHDEERYQETLHDVPSLHEINRMIARSEAEVEMFDQMDEEFEWMEDMTRFDQVPEWLRAGSKEVNSTIASLSKKPSKNKLTGENIIVGVEGERKRGRPRRNVPVYTEPDEEIEEFYESGSEERNGYSAQEEEEGEIEEFEEEDESPEANRETGPVYEYQKRVLEEAGSSGSSSHGRKVMSMVSPSISAQKFGSLSALDGRSNSRSKMTADDLEEGEIGGSGESQMELQQSGSWIQDREEGEDEQVLQPKIKRKRSIRVRPRLTTEEKYSDRSPLLRGNSPLLPAQVDHRKYKGLVEPNSLKKTDKNESSMIKNKRSLPLRKTPDTGKLPGPVKSGRVNIGSNSLDGEMMKGGVSGGNKMFEVIQRKCKNVISKLQRRIDKEGHLIIPLLCDLWKRIENSNVTGSNNNLLDLRKIDFRIDQCEYSGVMELVSDVQIMLKCGMQYYRMSNEVRSEARKVHDLFFDILKIAFPDTDFRESRNSLSFSGPANTPTTGQSSRQPFPIQNKRSNKSIKDSDSDKEPFQKPQTRLPIHTFEETSTKAAYTSPKPRPGNLKDEKRPFTHPGDLVICKKKRKDREKSTVKSPGPFGQHSGMLSGRANLSPQQGTSGGGPQVGWANPVKRMRSDAGRRRPSNL